MCLNKQRGLLRDTCEIAAPKAIASIISEASRTLNLVSISNS